MAIFRLVFSCEGACIGWRASYQITMAGVVATKLLAAGGAGGVALTAWALRSSGLKARTVARRMTSFEILLYAVFMGSLLVFGVGLSGGALRGLAPSTLTALPAAFGAAVIGLALAMRAVPDDIERRLSGLARRSRSRAAPGWGCWAPWRTGDSISPRCGRPFMRSAPRRRSRWW